MVGWLMLEKIIDVKFENTNKIDSNNIILPMIQIDLPIK